MIIAATISASITNENYIIPLFVVLISSILLYIMRGRVKEILADERDYEVAGHASRWAITVFSVFACVATFILYALRDLSPYYEVIASTLAYSTCFLMLVYGLIFRFYNKSFVGKNKWIYIVISILTFMIIIIAGLRLFSGEDSWVCDKGQWIEHGHPDFPTPKTECK